MKITVRNSLLVRWALRDGCTFAGFIQKGVRTDLDGLTPSFDLARARGHMSGCHHGSHRNQYQESTMLRTSHLYSQIRTYSTQPEVLVKESVDDNYAKRVQRHHHWMWEDHKMLAHAWLSVASKFEGPKKQTWKHVTDYFNKNTRSGPARRLTAVKSQWHWLNSILCEFNHIYNMLAEEHQSEWNEDQLKQRVHELYYQKNNKHFIYEDIWMMYKGDPSWEAYISAQRSFKKTRILEDRECASRSHQDSRFSTSEISTAEAAKEEGSGKKYSNASDEKSNLTTEKFRAMTKQFEEERKKAFECIARRVESHEFKSDYEILVRDTSGMSQQQLAAHEHMCNILKVKYNFP